MGLEVGTEGLSKEVVDRRRAGGAWRRWLSAAGRLECAGAGAGDGAVRACVRRIDHVKAPARSAGQKGRWGESASAKPCTAAAAAVFPQTAGPGAVAWDGARAKTAMASARNVLDALASRPAPTGSGAELPLPPPLNATPPRTGGMPLPTPGSPQVGRTMASPSAGSTSLEQLLAESRAARNSLTEALSPRMSPRRRAATVAVPPPFDLAATDTGAVVAAAAGALKKVEAEPENRAATRPRQASMPITPVSDEYAAEGTTAGGDAAFALPPPKGPSAPSSLPQAQRPDRGASVEPDCVSPVARPRRGNKNLTGGRTMTIWSRREVEAEVNAEQELELLRQQRAQ